VKSIAAALLLWINANSGYEYAGDPPHITTTDPENLAHMILGEIAWIPERAKSGLKGLYVVDTQTIWLRDDFDPQRQEDLSHLVHELVHFLQYQQGDAQRLACGRELEIEAYNIQNRYLSTHDLPTIKTVGAWLSQSFTGCSEL
jgi:hypothetical protein